MAHGKKEFGNHWFRGSNVAFNFWKEIVNYTFVGGSPIFYSLIVKFIAVKWTVTLVVRFLKIRLLGPKILVHPGNIFWLGYAATLHYTDICKCVNDFTLITYRVLPIDHLLTQQFSMYYNQLVLEPLLLFHTT